MQPKKKKYDITLLAALLFLVVFGLIILYSTSAYNGEVKFNDAFYYLKKQLFATCLGAAGMFFVAEMDYRVWKHAAFLGYFTMGPKDGCLWGLFHSSRLNLPKWR